jgi:hypothetical protein
VAKKQRSVGNSPLERLALFKAKPVNRDTLKAVDYKPAKGKSKPKELAKPVRPKPAQDPRISVVKAASEAGRRTRTRRMVVFKGPDSSGQSPVDAKADVQAGEGNFETEFKLWAEADSRQKSYVVQILHWFHYRPHRLRASWKQEEVLTWELLRALELLPQSHFLRPLLNKIASLSSQANAAVQPLLEAEKVLVTPYPTLGLSGGKRNCKSDIGLGLVEQPTIWIEAKTARFKASELEGQLRQQESSMAVLMPNVPKVLLTLLPAPRALHTFPNLSWDDVADALRSCDQQLTTAIPDQGLCHGYRLVVRELVGRIESHPNRVKGWV